MYYILLLYAFLMLFAGCNRAAKNTDRTAFRQEIQLAGLADSISIDPITVSRKIDSLLIGTDDSLIYYRLLLMKVQTGMRTAKIDSSRFLMHRIENYCHRSEESKAVSRLLAGVWNMKGNLYSRQSRLDSAIYAFKRSYSYAEKGNSENLPDVCLNLADAYVRKGRYDRGAYWYRKTLSIFDARSMGDDARFPVYYGLAQVNMELRNFESCDYYYGLAARSFDKMKPFEKYIYLNNRGNSYFFRKDYVTALGYFRRSLDLCRKHPELEFERNLAMVNLGEIFLNLNETDSASYYLNRCHHFFRSVNNTTALYYIDSQLIELALKQGNVEEATNRLQKAVKPEQVLPGIVHSRYRYLQHYYEQIGDFRQAYHYLNENQRIDDSIRNERVRMRTAEIALKYQQDSTLMKKELSIREKENEVLRLHQWLYAVILGVLLLVALAFVFWLVMKRRRDREQWRIQTVMTSLRLENVRNRISPHFIFNVLNREVGLRSEKDSKNLSGLIKLFRRNLEMTDNISVSLADELDFVKTYIDLEREVLGEQFDYDFYVDPKVDLAAVKIPSMLLQIPIENAIKHGLRMKEGRRLLSVRILSKDEAVELVISDNGGGFREVSPNSGTRTGMKVITQTIQLLNSYNRNPICLKIEDVMFGGEMGCGVRFLVPLDYVYQLKMKNYGKDKSGHC